MGSVILDEHSNKSHYDLKNLSDSSVTECYLEIGDGLNNNTEYVYSEAVSLLGGIATLITSFSGFMLNLLVIIAFTKTPTLRKEYLTPFMISLALTDFLFSAVALPMTAVTYFARDWPFGPALCKFYPLPYYGLIMCTWWNLAVIAIIRCIGVFCPAKMKQKPFLFGAKLLIVIAWTLSFLPLIPTLTERWGRHGLDCRTRKCTIISLPGELNPRVIIGQVKVILIMLFLIVFNTAIYIKLRNHSAQLRGSMARNSFGMLSKETAKKEKHFGRMMAALTILFILTYLPISILTGVIGPHATKKFPILGVMLLKFSHLSVVLDPMVYIIYHKKYRNAVKKVAKNIFMCRGTSEVDMGDTDFVSRQAFNSYTAIEKFKRARLSVNPPEYSRESMSTNI